MTQPDTNINEHSIKQELHTALRRAIGCFAIGDSRCEMNRSEWPKWVGHAEKTLKALRAEENTHD